MFSWHPVGFSLGPLVRPLSPLLLSIAYSLSRALNLVYDVFFCMFYLPSSFFIFFSDLCNSARLLWRAHWWKRSIHSSPPQLWHADLGRPQAMPNLHHKKFQPWPHGQCPVASHLRTSQDDGASRLLNTLNVLLQSVTVCAVHTQLHSKTETKTQNNCQKLNLSDDHSWHFESAELYWLHWLCQVSLIQCEGNDLRNVSLILQPCTVNLASQNGTNHAAPCEQILRVSQEMISMCIIYIICM